MGIKTKIVPTSTNYSLSQLQNWLLKIKEDFNEIHYDLIDGSYGKETFFDEDIVFNLLSDFNFVWFHLMVDEPFTFLTNKTTTLPKQNYLYLVRASKLTKQQVEKLKQQGFSIGLVFEINDSFNIDLSLTTLVDEFMFMPIYAGKTGQKPYLDVLNNVNEFYKNTNLEVMDKNLSIDGGLNFENLNKYKSTKANILYANSFFSSDYDLAVKTAKSL